MALVTIIQVSAGKAAKEEHENSRDTKRSIEEEVLAIENNKNDEHSRAAEAAGRKRSQVSECLTSCYSSYYVAEEPHYCDYEHRSRQEHIIYTTSIMFYRVDSSGCPAGIIKR